MARTYVIIGGAKVCDEGDVPNCYSSVLRATNDETLQSCTKEINDILQRVASTRTDRELCFLATPDDDLVLGWVKHVEVVNSQSKPDQIRRALGLVGGA